MADDEKTAKSEQAASAKIEFGPEDAKIINEFLQKQSHQVFKIPDVRVLIARSRLERLAADDIRVLQDYDSAVTENTLEHNLSALKKAIALDRPSLLIRPLCNINYIQYHQQKLKVLTIGPRSEAEIFDLVASGFPESNIRGLDLISYSDFVDLGDMHAMPYDDDSFDIILLGWVLGYSNDVPKVAQEVLRVLRPNGFVAIGQQYSPQTDEEVEKNLGYSLKGTRLDTTDEMLALFDGAIDSVFFRHDVHPTMRERNGDVMVVFQIKGD